jgi:LysR family hydrogen peroxide-inducible transcriptional activator
MNIRDLKYLVAVAEYRHFGKAAEASFVSQPALSMQIKKLEKYLGVQLLERTNKTVLLTSVGEKIARSATKILQDVEAMREVAKQTKDPFASELKLGLIPTLAPYLLPHIMPVIAKALPKLELYLIEEQTHNLLDKLKKGRIDAAILSPPLVDKELVVNHLFAEEFLLAVPPHHEWASRKHINQEALSGKNLLLLDDGHCLRDQALEICQAVKARENHSFRATSLETLRHMVASGIGMTLMPKLSVKEQDFVAYVEFSNPKPTRSISMVWRPTAVKEVVLQELQKIITHCKFD